MPRVILVVDDESALATLLAEVLTDDGFTVRTAANGADALDEQRRDPADVILSDVMMPLVDGLTLVQRLRARGDHTPVVLMSAAGQVVRLPPEIPFVPKPFNIEDLLAVVHQAIDRPR